ncbi:MAG TPA: hypothetical protein VM889_11440 [Candidatus Thermoplasmatota archaeon]|nr:hypothetical protein [Candidatus Thermoplasmatota archaeon]
MLPRTFALATLALLVAGALSGCLGGGASDVPPPATNDTRTPDLADDVNLTDDGVTPRNASLDQMPHMHDYWKGQERVTLFDGVVDTSVASWTTFFTLFFETRPGLGGAFLNLPDGATVYEGTGVLEFTASWDTATVTGLTLRYRHAASPQLSPPIALANKQTHPIEVTPEMVDMPHSSSSRWFFVLEGGAPSGAGLAHGPVNVKIDIVKMRDIEKFPGHPDQFEGLETLVIHDEDATIKADTAAAGTQNYVAKKNDPPGIVPQKLVPMEAQLLTVTVELKAFRPTNPAQQPNELQLYYRSADTFRYRPAERLSGDGKTFTYAIPVEMKMGDGFYAEESAWRFYPVVFDNAAGQPIQIYCLLGSCFDYEMDTHVTITAHKTWPEGVAIKGTPSKR